MSQEDKEAVDSLNAQRTKQTQSAPQLTAFALSYDKELTIIDQHIQGLAAGIGAPFATAQWNGSSHTWDVRLNSACVSTQH